MRLIDADTLKEEFDMSWQPDMAVTEMWSVIDNAPTVGGWISVKDRLPEKGQDVLLQFPSNMAVGSFDHGEWLVYSGGNWYTNVCTSDGDELPTHWMPLPEPPKEAQDGEGC